MAVSGETMKPVGRSTNVLAASFQNNESSHVFLAHLHSKMIYCVSDGLLMQRTQKVLLTFLNFH